MQPYLTALTLSRLILSPLLLIPIANGDRLSFTIFGAILGLTDFFDGYFARKYNLVTHFGQRLDSYADAAWETTMVLGLIIFLKNDFLQNPIPLLLIFIASIFNQIILYKKFRRECSPHFATGKVTMLLFQIASFYILIFGFNHQLYYLVTISSLIHSLEVSLYIRLTKKTETSHHYLTALELLKSNHLLTSTYSQHLSKALRLPNKQFIKYIKYKDVVVINYLLGLSSILTLILQLPLSPYILGVYLGTRILAFLTKSQVNNSTNLTIFVIEVGLIIANFIYSSHLANLVFLLLYIVQWIITIRHQNTVFAPSAFHFLLLITFGYHDLAPLVSSLITVWITGVFIIFLYNQSQLLNYSAKRF